jgi:hypothetical protein
MNVIFHVSCTCKHMYFQSSITMSETAWFRFKVKCQKSINRFHCVVALYNERDSPRKYDALAAQRHGRFA